MSRAKKVSEEDNYPTYGLIVEDEDVLLVLKSNVGGDKGKFLEKAKKSPRPIQISIESEVFDTYKFRCVGLSREQARSVVRELNRMLDYLEE